MFPRQGDDGLFRHGTASLINNISGATEAYGATRDVRAVYGGSITADFERSAILGKFGGLIVTNRNSCRPQFVSGLGELF